MQSTVRLIAQKKYLYLLFILFIFFLLAGKNLFSENNLISNLEPYPDGLFYTVPAWRFVKQLEFQMRDDFISMRSIIPPGYTILIIPILAIFKDIRTFYLTNMILMSAAVILFFLITNIIFSNKKHREVLSFLAGIILVTNYYFFTFPTLPMAETPTIFFQMLLIYLFVINNKTRSVFLVVFCLVYLLFIKVANIPITLAFGIAFLIKYFFELNYHNNKKNIQIFLTASIVGLVIWLGYFLGNRQYTNDFAQVMKYKAFSPDYFFPNLKFYLQTLMGQHTKILWFDKSSFAPFFFIPSLLGGFYILKISRNLLILYMLFSIITIVFFCFLMLPDARYIFSLWPFMAISSTVFICFILDYLREIGKILSSIILMSFFLSPTFGQGREAQILTLKKQIGLNYIHAEKPWNYLAVKHFNTFFKNKNNNPILLTVLPSFYVSFYYNKKYQIFPFTEKVEFFHYKGSWKDVFANKTIDQILDEKLRNTEELFITNAYITNSTEWVEKFESIKNRYDLNLVSIGCLDACNIYKISAR